MTSQTRRSPGEPGGRRAWIVGLWAMALWLAACTAQLSPPFDQAIYDKVVGLNEQTETLYASLSNGGSAGSFAAKAADYDAVIGGFSALRLQIAARPVPSGISGGLGPLAAVCGSAPADCIDTTTHHLDKIVSFLTAQRDLHQRGKLTAGLVALNKGQYEAEMNPILTFETALQR